MSANPTSEEAVVWNNIQGKSPVMQRLQREFMQDFQQKGFGMVSGSKWTQHNFIQEVDSSTIFMTREQIFKEECKSVENTESKIQWAINQGEGVDQPGKQKGFYKDETRQNAYVYRYQRNTEYKEKMQKQQGRQTMNSTGFVVIMV